MTDETPTTLLRTALQRLKRDDVRHVTIDAVLEYIDELEASGARDRRSAIELEHYKAQLAAWIERQKEAASMSVEGFKSVILAGQSSLRSAMLINGGAAVAVLAYIGKLTGDASGNIVQFALPLLLFVLGALVVAVGAGVTYLSQWFYFGGGGWKSKVGFGLNILAILLGVGSWALFAAGAWLAYLAFSSLPVVPSIGV